MNEFERSLVVRADGQRVEALEHIRLTGKEKVGLLPTAYMLFLWNLSDDQYLLLSRAKFLEVEHLDSILASGEIADVFRYTAEDGLITAVVFSISLKLWEAPVSLAVPAGKTVSERVKALLEESGTGIQLLTYTGSDPVSTRGQSYFGRAAEAISITLSAASARGYLVPAGLCVLMEEDQPISMTLFEEDLLMPPEYPSGNKAVLRLAVAGWPIGKKAEVRYQGKSFVGIISECMQEVDNKSGPWYSEVLMEVRRGE